MPKKIKNVLTLGKDESAPLWMKLLLILIIPAIIIAISVILYYVSALASEFLYLLIYLAIGIAIISGSMLSEKSRISIYLLIPALITILLYLLYYFEFLDNLWAFLLSMIALVIGCIVNIMDRKENRSAFILSAYIIGLWIIFNMLEITFNIGLWELIGLASDSEGNVFWSLRMAILSLFAVPVVYFTNKDIRAGLKEDKEQLMSLDPKQKKILMYGLLIIIGVIIADILIILYVPDALIMMISLFVATFMTLMPLTFLLSRSEDIGEGLDKITTAITMLMGTIIAPLILVLVIIPVWEGNLGGLFGGVIFKGLLASGEQYGGIYPAQGGINYFSYVFYILLQSPAPALMIGFMIFGAVTVMVAQNLGGVGSILGGFASSVVVIIPMIFIFTIFSGGIAPPEVLVDLLGLGTASFVFGLAETSAFILMLSIIAVFISAGKLLSTLV